MAVLRVIHDDGRLRDGRRAFLARPALWRDAGGAALKVLGVQDVDVGVGAAVDAGGGFLGAREARDADVIHERLGAVLVEALEHHVHVADRCRIVTMDEVTLVDWEHVLDVVPVAGVVDGLQVDARVVLVRSGRPDVVARIAFGEALPRAPLDVVRDQALVLRGALERLPAEGVAPTDAVRHGHDEAVVAVGVLHNDRGLRPLVRSLAVPAHAAGLEVLGEERVRGLDGVVHGGRLLRGARVPLDLEVVKHGLLAVKVEALEDEVDLGDGQGVVAVVAEGREADGEHVLDVLPLRVVVVGPDVLALVVGRLCADANER